MESNYVPLISPFIGYIRDDSSGVAALKYMSILPAILIALFAGLYVYMRKREDAV